ncbi:TetR/AcrR family transcriptional regulator [Agromyces protaetiae]|uniref:TetR/AcrR family transcriptional regulator n=1 Tax=Agromyces protaetiae TaxID=2509455 RepID=A0A4P6FF70_9MICO|nr:TetR family transcriptional regulator [Agromyces protaetiae]QAY73039.1 TetR/AcrR family transcriptional regulator [Agromyces protaetiae]
MAWDTERTKRLLLDAATAEFSEHGLAGARVDRIAASAGVNKERIYQYFGNKAALLRAVLETRLTSLVDEVPMRLDAGDPGADPEASVGADAVADYAGRLYDHHLADQTIPRLIFWEGLEVGRDESPASRFEYNETKVGVLQSMLPGVDRRAAGELLLTIVSLVNAFPVLPQLDRQMVGDGPDRIAERRTVIVDAVTLLARAAIERAAVERAGIVRAADSTL